MDKLVLFVLGSMCFYSPSLWADTPENWEKGQQIYQQNCATCHGRQAEKRAFGISSVINTLDEQTLLQALQDRQQGRIRGAGNGVKARLSEQQTLDVVKYITTLHSRHS